MTHTTPSSLADFDADIAKSPMQLLREDLVRMKSAAEEGHHPDLSEHLARAVASHGRIAGQAYDYAIRRIDDLGPICVHCGAGPLTSSANLRDGVACVNCLCGGVGEPPNHSGQATCCSWCVCPGSPDDFDADGRCVDCQSDNPDRFRLFGALGAS